ncbi:antibiotic biosynthesis monooxygenase [Rubrobacter indicoceani]|uniref:putative quinol monooxygenase n=1 Tax=Rubrobacter indicoceani TaxID=2051957 RepID=UPI000E5C0B57
MIIVAGHPIVVLEQRDLYLAGCAGVVEQARRSSGCLDFTFSADLVDTGRIGTFKRRESQEAAGAFRGSGPGDERRATILSAAVVEYKVTEFRSLT